MVSADVALANLMNRTAVAYVQHAPAFITYRERTHVSAPALRRTQEIDRFVAVRQVDDFAVMQDLPQGAQRSGHAFPIIPYFNPFALFNFSWFANLKNVDITLERCQPTLIPLPPPDPSVDFIVPYFSYLAPSYAPDSSDARLHLLIGTTPRTENGTIYPVQVIEDPHSHLPARIEMQTTQADETIVLDFQVLQSHWVVTHGTFTTRQRVGPMSFTVVGETTYDQFTFPATAPDLRLTGPPVPQQLKCT